MVHAFNPRTWEAEAGGFLSSKPAWSTGQPGLQRNPVSKKTEKNKNKKTHKSKTGVGWSWGKNEGETAVGT